MNANGLGFFALMTLVAASAAHPAVSSSSSSSSSSTGGGGGSYSSSGPGFPMAFAGNFGFPNGPNGIFARSGAGPIGSYAGFGDQGGFYGQGQGDYYNQFPPQPDYNALYQQFLMQQQQQFGFPNQGNTGYNTGYNNGPDGFASASASLGPNGGYGQVAVDNNGLGLRTAEFSSPPNAGGGNGDGTFSTFSSSSSSSQDANGQRTSFKQASVGVNDNGKVYFKTVSS